LDAALAAQGLAALVATAPENVRYLTDYETSALFIYRFPGAFAVAVPGQDPVLLVGMAGLEYIVERPVSTRHIHTTGTYHVGWRPDAPLAPAEERLQALRRTCPHWSSAEEALAGILSAHAGRGPIGIDAQGLAAPAWRALVQRLAGAAVREAGGTLQDLRRVKTPEETGILREAAAINEGAAGHALAAAGIGVPERRLETDFWAEVARRGAVPGHWETTIGPRSSGSFHASDYAGQPGDLIRSDSSCRFRGYWSDVGRTRVVGEPRAAHARTYEALRLGQEAALAAVRPGVRVGALFALAVDTIRRSGIPDYRRHHIGHGIGLEMYEAPLLVEGSDARLEAGMVVNIETPYYESGYGGFQIEDTVLVTETGGELLTKADRTLALAGGAG